MLLVEVVALQRSFFTQATATHRQSKLKDRLQPIFSQTWEDLCRSCIPLLSLDKKVFGPASRYWHGSNPEWDILAESLDSKSLFIEEAKWIAKRPSSNWIYKTIARHSKQELIYALFIPEKPHNLELSYNTIVIDAEDILNVIR